MTRPSTYQVKEVSRISGLSVRTLHYYDEIGLLRPSARSEAGYRIYADKDLLRLQQILIGRELGLTLEEVRRSLDDPGFDLERTLRGQRKRLQAKAAATRKMLQSVDRALSILEHREGGTMTDIQEIFDGFDPSKYDQEAKDRWGDTDAYAEAARRTNDYTAEDWRTIKTEAAAIYNDAACLMGAGVPADDEKALAVAERHRAHIDRWFYPCGPEMHAGLADLYEADPRFAKNIDKHGAGLTGYFSAAIRANSGR